MHMPKQATLLAAFWRGAKQQIRHVRMRRFSQTSIDAAFPTRCWHCDELYFRNFDPVPSEYGSEKEAPKTFSALMADYICPTCTDQYEPIDSPLCHKCGLPFATRHGVDHDCPDCRLHPYEFDVARAAGPLDQSMKTIIHHYKYQGRTELAWPLGNLLWDALHTFYNMDAFDLILPVPLHWFRRYRRGFNQSALLMRPWETLAKELGVDLHSVKISEKVLFRHRHTDSQTGLGKDQRAANLKKAFVVRNPEDVQGMHVLLVDDVLTTGATTNACAKALKGAGAVSVKVLTVARAV